MLLPRWVGVLGLIVAGAAVALLAMRLWPRPVINEPTVIRSYQVQPDIAREVHGVLQHALQPDSMLPLGSVTLAPGGRLVVTARPTVQAGVAKIVQEIDARQPAGTPSIAFDLWLVSARPGGDGAGAAPPGLAEVAPALEELRKAHGPLRFELAEKLSLIGRPGDVDSEVSGNRVALRVQPTLRRAEDGSPRVAAEIQVVGAGGGPQRGPPVQLKSIVELRPGELLVIGERVAGEHQDGGTDLYYIVRARL